MRIKTIFKKTMRKFYFILLLTFTTISVGVSGNEVNVLNIENIVSNQDPNQEIRIFPNPTTDFFSVKNDDNLETIVIYNIVGKEVKRISHVAGNKYDIGFLQNGIYIVRLYDDSNKVLKVLRLNKE